MNIGIFDSGLGGLTILKDILTVLPEYNYIYLGDNARIPYGNRSANIVYEFTEKAVGFLMEQDCSLIILACNTATATSLYQLQHNYLPKKYPNRRILGVIKPTAEAAVENNFQHVMVIGTHATVESQTFVREIHKLNPKMIISQLATPLLVPLIEEDRVETPEMDLIIQEYLTKILPQKPEALILGCTHYGLIANKIEKFAGEKIKVISEGKIVARKLKEYLIKHQDLENDLTKNQLRKFYVTDLNDFYKNQIKIFLGAEFKNKEHLQLALYKVDNN
jgi:glutamate racemase